MSPCCFSISTHRKRRKTSHTPSFVRMRLRAHHIACNFQPFRAADAIELRWTARQAAAELETRPAVVHNVPYVRQTQLIVIVPCNACCDYVWSRNCAIRAAVDKHTNQSLMVTIELCIYNIYACLLLVVCLDTVTRVYRQVIQMEKYDADASLGRRLVEVLVVFGFYARVRRAFLCVLCAKVHVCAFDCSAEPAHTYVRSCMCTTCVWCWRSGRNTHASWIIMLPSRKTTATAETEATASTTQTLALRGNYDAYDGSSAVRHDDDNERRPKCCLRYS